MLTRLRSFGTALRRRKRCEETLRQEQPIHEDADTHDLIKPRMSGHEAHRSTRRRYGIVDRVRNGCQDARWARSRHASTQDVRVWPRVLWSMPLVSGGAVITIALAIASSLLTFRIVDGSAPRQLPFERGDRIMLINAEFEALDLRDFRDRQESFDQVEGYSLRRVTLVRQETPRESLRAGVLTAGAIDLLGVPPLLGRTFVDGEDFISEIRHVVIGERLWRTRFDGAPDIIGTRLRIADLPLLRRGAGARSRITDRLLEVVGVMPVGFRFPFDEDLWIPMDWDLPTDANRGSGRSFVGFGRLRDGVTEERAEVEAGFLFSVLWGEGEHGPQDPNPRHVFPLADRYVW